MKIFKTGIAGFIGFSLTKKFKNINLDKKKLLNGLKKNINKFL